MGNRNFHVPLDVKLVAKIGLSVTLASGVGLLLVLLPIGDQPGTGYRQVIGAFGSVRQNLGPAMLVFGLVMVGFAGMTTWLLSLYTSFRIAGPLFRISRNLEMQLEQGPVAPVPLRTTDTLQDEWKAFESGVGVLRAHQEDLRQAFHQVESAVAEHQRTGDANALGQAMARLKKIEQRVSL